MKLNTILTSLLLSTPALFAGSDSPYTREADTWSSWSGSGPDGHAPIGVMGDHTHGAGDWMFSYRYMFMAMEENRDGTSSVSDASVLADPRFGVVPTDMDMEMHMIGLMYAPTDRLTLMAMLNYVELSMNHIRGMGNLHFKTKSSGVGDSSLTALYRFWDGHKQRAHFGFGLLLPTAETDESDFIPPPVNGTTRLPYPMQLGAGSWGIAPSLTYLGQNDLWSWGAQASAKLYLDDNDEGYRLGNKAELTTWGARRLSEMVSISLRATASHWSDIHGSDDDLLPLPVPTADPDLRGGTKVDLSFGVNVLLPIEGARLGLELGRPVWQDLDGPQLASDWWFLGGLQYAF